MMGTPYLKNIILLGCFVCMTAACNEVDVPEPPVQAAPVFSMQLDVDGSSTDLAAGRDNYFMYTNYEVGQDDVLRLVGILRPKDCRDICERSFRFILTDIAPYAPGRFQVDRILKRGMLPFQWDVDPNQIRVHLQDKSTVTPSLDLIRTWEYENNISHDSSIVFTTKKEDLPRVCLTLDMANDDWQSSFCRVIQPGKNSNCKVMINFRIEDRTVVLSVRGDIDMSRIQWSNGSTEPSIKVKYEVGAFYSVQLNDSESCDIQLGLRFGNRMINGVFHSFFTAESASVRAQPEMSLGSVRIDYKDLRGELYSTKFFKQPSDSFFEIASVSDFNETGDGKKTKKLGIRFSCLIYNELGDRIKLNNGRGHIAVAYPD